MPGLAKSDRVWRYPLATLDVWREEISAQLFAELNASWSDARHVDFVGFQNSARDALEAVSLARNKYLDLRKTWVPPRSTRVT